MFSVKTARAAGCAILMLGGALAISAPAQAGESTGRWRDGSYATPYGIVRPYAAYDYRRPYYRHRSDNGAAVATGMIGGLALGALAARPAYSYPAYPGGYYGANAYSEPDCYTVRRRFVDEWGRVIIRREQICE